MKLKNAITPPNAYLKAYRSITFSVPPGTFFALTPGRSNFVWKASDNTFLPGDSVPFYADEHSAILNGENVRDNGLLVVRKTTKKMQVQFHKHPSAAATPFLSNYSAGKDMFLATSPGALPDPLNALAKDGDELEIYGPSEIAKFFTSPLDSAFASVPYLLTIILFE